MKIIDIIKKSRIILEDFDIKTSQLDSELLIAHVLEKEREYIHVYPENEIDGGQVKKVFKLVKKRAKGKPLAYILGKKSFYNLDFKVTKNTLIPRPETEILVDEARDLGLRFKNKKVNFIDVGTGSGCIIISLKDLFKNYNNFNFYGIDRYRKTLKVAEENSEENNFKDIKFIKSNLLKYLLKNKDKPQEYNIITANLPYLTKQQYKESLSIKNEPKRALISKESGMRHYKKLFDQINDIKNELKFKFYIICEIDSSQDVLLKNLIIKKFKLDESSIKIKKDLAGLNRFVIFHLFD